MQLRNGFMESYTAEHLFNIISMIIILLSLLSSAAVKIYAECISPSLLVTPLVSKNFVAEIKNFELETITDAQFEEVESLLLQYKVLVFRNQSLLSVPGQRSFSQRFGQLQVHIEKSSHHPEYEDVNVISHIKENGSYIGLYGAHVESYHTDLSW
jgi:alpha-ketoglutarate-dependent taurine dioxygenase